MLSAEGFPPAAAMARAAAQREAAPLPEQHSSGLNDAKQAAIAAAMARAAARKSAADEAKAAKAKLDKAPKHAAGHDHTGTGLITLDPKRQ